MHDVLTPELFGFILRWWVVIILGYLTLGWLAYGLMTLLGDVPPGQEYHMLVRCLLAWWAALALELAIGVRRLLKWLADIAIAAARAIFDPHSGPLVRSAGELGMLYRHFKARFAGRDPYVTPPPEPTKPTGATP